MLFDDKELETVAQKKKFLKSYDVLQDSTLHADICSLINDFPRAAAIVGIPQTEHGWLVEKSRNFLYREEFYIMPDGSGYYKRVVTQKSSFVDPGVEDQEKSMSTSELAAILIGKYEDFAKEQARFNSCEISEMTTRMSEFIRSRIKSSFMAVFEE